jgi:hypothetical protein
MADIIIVKTIEFYERKGLVNDPIIEAKYNKLFQQYVCFSDNAVVVIQPNIASKIYKKSAIFHNSNRQHHHHNVTHIKKEPKTVKKYILGILNIINITNYKKMVVKIKMYINHDNINEIFNEILEKCIIQIFYLSIYIDLIKDIMNSLSDNEKLTAIDIINKFVNAFIKDEKYILLEPKTDNSYHDFCIMQKNKMIILSNNSIIIALLKNTDYLADVNIKSYSDLIFNTFMNNIKLNVAVADILLQMIIELVKNGSHFDCNVLKTISTSTNAKITFLIKDIIELH